ncbi:hypothetical protein GM3708_650 [Geminocystis sp. NIES-3708]|nr:hypothetical protein GM3708_650 [Geminocystis sp. NIES-3708]
MEINTDNQVFLIMEQLKNQLKKICSSSLFFQWNLGLFY